MKPTISPENAGPPRPARRKPGQSVQHFDFVVHRKIEKAFKRVAKKKMHGEGHNRNLRWRIAEEERAQTLSDEDNW